MGFHIGKAAQEAESAQGIFQFPHTLADSKYRFAQTLYTGFQME